MEFASCGAVIAWLVRKEDAFLLCLYILTNQSVEISKVNCSGIEAGDEFVGWILNPLECGLLCSTIDRDGGNAA